MAQDSYVGLLHKKIEALEDEKKKNRSKNKTLALIVFVLLLIQCVFINFIYKKDENVVKVEDKAKVEVSFTSKIQNKAINNEEEINKINKSINIANNIKLKQEEQINSLKNTDKENKNEVKQESNNIEYVKEDIVKENKSDQIALTEENKLIDTKENSSTTNDTTEQMKLLALRENGLAIQYIDNPTEQMKILAIRENGLAIQYIDNPTEQMKLIAVRQNGLTIQYINEPTEQMKLLAITDNVNAFPFIKNPTEQMKLLALRENGLMIQYIDNPTEKMKLLAVKENAEAIKYIAKTTQPKEEIKQTERSPLKNEKQENVKTKETKYEKSNDQDGLINRFFKSKPVEDFFNFIYVFLFLIAMILGLIKTYEMLIELEK